MKNRQIVLFMALIAVIITVAGCNPSRKWEKEEAQIIESYLQRLGDTAYVLKPSGLYYIELEEGTGRMPQMNDTVAFRYTAKLLDGRLFDSNVDAAEPITFIVGSNILIKGIEEGVRYMKDGGKARLITPSSLAYGTQGVWGVIPGYTPIYWNIELVSVKAGSK